MYVLHLMDSMAASGICLLFIVGFECISIGWGYGADRFFDNIREMIGFYPLLYIKLCWVYICPVICGVSSLGKNKKYTFSLEFEILERLSKEGITFPKRVSPENWLSFFHE